MNVTVTRDAGKLAVVSVAVGLALTAGLYATTVAIGYVQCYMMGGLG